MDALVWGTCGHCQSLDHCCQSLRLEVPQATWRVGMQSNTPSAGLGHFLAV